MEIIKVENLRKNYGEFVAVNKVSFGVEEGSMLGFLGVNGAGKTTVIHMLSTLLKPDEGRVEICGHVLGKEDEEIRKKIGIVYQANVLDDILTVQENLMCRGILHGASRMEAKIYEKRMCKNRYHWCRYHCCIYGKNIKGYVRGNLDELYAFQKNN